MKKWLLYVFLQYWLYPNDCTCGLIFSSITCPSICWFSESFLKTLCHCKRQKRPSSDYWKQAKWTSGLSQRNSVMLSSSNWLSKCLVDLTSELEKGNAWHAANHIFVAYIFILSIEFQPQDASLGACLWLFSILLKLLWRCIQTKLFLPLLVHSVDGLLHY